MYVAENPSHILLRKSSGDGSIYDRLLAIVMFDHKSSSSQLIDLRKKLQENPVFHGKIDGFLKIFP